MCNKTYRYAVQGSTCSDQDTHTPIKFRRKHNLLVCVLLVDPPLLTAELLDTEVFVCVVSGKFRTPKNLHHNGRTCSINHCTSYYIVPM